MSKLPLSALCLAVLMGCASEARNPLRTDACFQGFVDEELLQSQLADAAPCCTGFDTMTFESMAVPPSTEMLTTIQHSNLPTPASTASVPRYRTGFAVWRNAPVFVFDTGKSHFAALDLATLPLKPKLLTILPGGSGHTARGKTCADKLAVPGASERVRYLLPRVQYLDAAKKPIGQGVSGRKTRLGIAGALAYDVPAGAAYLVIYSDPANFGNPIEIAGGVTYTIMPVIGSPTLFIPMPVDGTVRGTVTSTGVFSLQFD